MQSVNDTGLTYANSSETITLSHSSTGGVIDPNTTFTYIINNTDGNINPVDLTMGSGSYPGQQKTIIVTEGGEVNVLHISYINNYGTPTTTNLFGTACDILQFISTPKGWGVSFFDIK